MSKREFVFHVALPATTFGVYASVRFMRLLPAEFGGIAFSEHGVIENGTALFFALAACAAWMLCMKTRNTVPRVYRGLFCLYGVVASWVALEEISYGQHMFGWQSPAWFAEHNAHHETNFHNLMSDAPSHWLNRCASFGTIGGFVVLPILARLRRWSDRPGYWAYYLLPRAELMTNVVLAQLCQWFYDMPALKQDPVQFHLGWNEIREYYWGVLAITYILVMWQRLCSAQRENPSAGTTSPGREGARLPLQAA